MDYRTTIFLVGMSHGWGMLIAPVLAVPTLLLLWRRRRAEMERARDTPAWAASRAAGVLLSVLTCLSLGSCAVSVSHIGCAGLVAQNNQCMSNTKMLTLAALIYAQDYDERLPGPNWAEQIDGHGLQAARASTVTPSPNPYRCPTTTSLGSYGVNQALSGKKIGAIAEPAATVWLFETEAPIRSFVGGRATVAVERHFGRPNFAFADGHTKRCNEYVRSSLNWTAAAAPPTKRP